MGGCNCDSFKSLISLLQNVNCHSKFHMQNIPGHFIDICLINWSDMSHVSGVNLKGWLNVHKLLNIVSQWIVDSVKCKLHVDCIQSPVNCVTTSASTSSILARDMFGPLQGICGNNTAPVIHLFWYQLCTVLVNGVVYVLSVLLCTWVCAYTPVDTILIV